MIKHAFVPTLKWSYFVVIMSLIHLISMVSMAVVSAVKYHEMNEKIFLGPLPETLYWVNKNPFQIQRKLQLWRVFSPIFFHVGYSHMVFNVSSQIIFGGLLEMMVGTKHMIIAYFTAGVGGNLLSACMTDRTSVGASTAVFGIFTGHIAVVAVNWFSFGSNP